jgi:succinate dehydrogenase/fumarate reductase flavoprotein subunit
MHLVKSWGGGAAGEFIDPNILYKLYGNAYWALEESERIGVNNKWDDGDYYWQATPWRGYESSRSLLRVHWLDIKPWLAKAVKKSGVKVLERTMIVDLLTSNGSVVGATAVNTRTGEFIVIKTKATVIATGIFERIYNPETPSYWKHKFPYQMCPASNSGDGYAAAYRAGANLINMELPMFGSNIIRDPFTMSVGNLYQNEGIPMKALTPSGEEISPHVTTKEELEMKGIGPIYQTIEHLPDDYQKRIEVAYADEKLISFKLAEDRGFNPKTHRYEVVPHPQAIFINLPGIEADEYGKTRVKGLYAVGDAVAGLHSCGHAFPTGFYLGENLPSFINGDGESIIDEEQVESQKKAAFAPMTVTDGTEPLELETAIRYITGHYAGTLKIGGKIEEGLRRLMSLKNVFLPQSMAKNNPHHLMRCLEVRNLFDLAEVHLNASLCRKESRSHFVRLDYPEPDPAMDGKIICQRQEDDKTILEIKEVPKLKPEYGKEAD